MRTRALRTIFVGLITLATAASCRTDLPDVHPAPVDEPVATRSPDCDGCSPAVPSDYEGVWSINRHERPGVSAMSDAEAIGMYGRIIRLSADEAISSAERCAAPKYAVRQTTPQEIRGAYSADPKGLRILDYALRLFLVDVSCPAGRFSGPGTRVILTSHDTALTMWDGIFFDMARYFDIRGAGQEPFWTIEIKAGKELRFTYDAGERVVVMPFPQPTSRSAAYQYHAVTDMHDLLVVVAFDACVDVVSGRSFPETVTVTLDGQTFEGCAQRIDYRQNRG